MKLFLSVAILLLPFFVPAQSKNEKEIMTVLATQTSAWNKGDIEGFMETYWKNDSLKFIGKNSVTYGWQNTLERYKKSYAGKEAMGILNFNILYCQKLSRKYYNVVGKWHLKRQIGDLQGHFTLILKKINGRWMIIQDHSS